MFLASKVLRQNLLTPLFQYLKLKVSIIVLNRAGVVIYFSEFLNQKETF